MKSPIVIVLCPLLISLFSGCVTGRRSFDLTTPTAQSYPVSASKGPITIGEIRDVREFQNHPDSPSTPSIDGDVNTLTAQQKSTFIGRQRNGFGEALGDVVLPEGQTVQRKVAALLREGLMRRGYSIVEAGATENTVTAEIHQFWSWLTPQFVMIGFDAEIECRVTITRAGKQFTFQVRGSGNTHGQVVKAENWQEAFDEVFNNFLKDLDDKLANAGF
jgi:hypothetical protein